MEQDDPHSLNEDERDALLGRGGVGVLSFNRPGHQAPHAVPVSYGYDPETGALYFRLAVSGDRMKDDLLDEPVSFVAYDHTEDGYASVVAQGTLEAVDREDVDTDDLEGLARVEIPLFDVFDRDPREIDFTFCRLTADEVTGQRELQRLE